jgi:hypothetical protein
MEIETCFLWYFDVNEQQYDFSSFRLPGPGLFPRLVFRTSRIVQT